MPKTGCYKDLLQNLFLNVTVKYNTALDLYLHYFQKNLNQCKKLKINILNIFEHVFKLLMT